MADTERISIIIAEDHRIVRDGIRGLLELESDLQVLGEATNAEQAITLCLQQPPDVLLLDFALSGHDGLDVMRRLRASDALPPTVILTAAIEERQVIAALDLGLKGLVMKYESTDVLLRSIRAVYEGEYWIQRPILAEWAKQARRRNDADLTAREEEVVQLVVAGAPNREIATRLNVSVATVKRHLTNIFEKLGVTSRLELAVFAMNNRLITDDKDKELKRGL